MAKQLEILVDKDNNNGIKSNSCFCIVLDLKRRSKPLFGIINFITKKKKTILVDYSFIFYRCKYCLNIIHDIRNWQNLLELKNK